MLALPGSVYLYQGEELGLWEVEDLPDEAIEDPIWERSGHRIRGRDGCRVPLPWSGTEPPFGFSTGTPWLPQPAAWAAHTAEAQQARPGSMLHFYRAALALRPGGDDPLRWLEAPPGVLAFARRELTCVLNLSGAPIPLHGDVLIASAQPAGDLLPADAAAWLRPG
jgi:alpha-glucosidase